MSDSAGSRDNRNKTVLITGGCGFIGTNLVKYLSERGYTVRILDNLTSASHKFVSQESRVTSPPPQPSTRNSELRTLDSALPTPDSRLPTPDLVVGDIRDREAVARAVAGAGAVVHLAAHTSVVESLENPQEDWDINVGGTINVLEACRRSGVDRFIFASSNAVVGEQEPPIDENKIPQPLSPYGASKLAGEALCSTYYHSFGLKTVSLRFANCYGPFSDHKSSVISIFLDRAKQGKPLTIYGDGNQTRDFVHVDDICQAIQLALEQSGSQESRVISPPPQSPDSGLNTRDSELGTQGSRLFQIGSGVETSINDLANLIRQIAEDSPPAPSSQRTQQTLNSELLSGDAGLQTQDSRLKTIYEPERKGEIRRNYSDIGKARAVLGFEPKVGLRYGLNDLWEWSQEHGKGT